MKSVLAVGRIRPPRNPASNAVSLCTMAYREGLRVDRIQRIVRK